MKKFSILVPTRNRRNNVRRLINSIRTTTDNIEDIEILFATDEDDSPSLLNLMDIKKEYPELDIKIHTRKRSEFLNKDYYNWLAEKAISEFCWIVGDDCVFLVDKWDTILLKEIYLYLSYKKDGIICASVKDNTPKPSPHLPPFPCFPLISKEAINVLGFALHPEVPTWGADYLVYVLYTKIGRLLRIDDQVYLNHVSYHTTHDLSLQDDVNKRIGSIFNKTKMMPEHNIQKLEREKVPGQVQLVVDYIKECEKKAGKD